MCFQPSTMEAKYLFLVNYVNYTGCSYKADWMPQSWLCLLHSRRWYSPLCSARRRVRTKHSVHYLAYMFGRFANQKPARNGLRYQFSMSRNHSYERYNVLYIYICIYIQYIYIYIYNIYIYRVSQEECARLREGVPDVKVYRYNPKHLCPNLNGYGDNGWRSLKLWQLLHTCWLPNAY